MFKSFLTKWGIEMRNIVLTRIDDRLIHGQVDVYKRQGIFKMVFAEINWNGNGSERYWMQSGNYTR